MKRALLIYKNAQEAADLRAEVERRGWEVASECTHLSDAELTDLDRGRYDALVVKRVSSIATDFTTLVTVMDRCKRRKRTLIVEDLPMIDTDTAEGRMVYHLVACLLDHLGPEVTL